MVVVSTFHFLILVCFTDGRALLVVASFICICGRVWGNTGNLPMTGCAPDRIIMPQCQANSHSIPYRAWCWVSHLLIYCRIWCRIQYAKSYLRKQGACRCGLFPKLLNEIAHQRVAHRSESRKIRDIVFVNCGMWQDCILPSEDDVYKPKNKSLGEGWGTRA